MLKLLLIDDESCKKELALFVKKQSKAIQAITNPDDLLTNINQLLYNLNHQSTTQKKIVVNTTESITVLDVSKIIRCESNRNYTYIYMADKKKIIASKTLMEFEDLLKPYQFLRVHKSHLINISYIEKYIKSEGGYIVLTDGSKLPVAIRKKEYLFNALDQL